MRSIITVCCSFAWQRRLQPFAGIPRVAIMRESAGFEGSLITNRLISCKSCPALAMPDVQAVV
jgi:hypothetical protein